MLGGGEMSTQEMTVCSCEWETALGEALTDAVKMVHMNMLAAPQADRLIEIHMLLLTWDRAKRAAEAAK